MSVGLVLDCADPAALAAFWAPALGYEDLGSAGSYTLLVPGEGRSGPQLLLQRVDEPKAGKNRMHFDIHIDDIETERDRLLGLGAVLLEPEALEEHGIRWWVMADPEGNEFCVCSAPAVR